MRSSLLLLLLVFKVIILSASPSDSLQLKVNAISDKKEKFELLMKLSKSLMGTDITKSFTFSDQAMAIAKAENEPKLLRKALLNRGLITRVKGDIKTADSLMTASLKLSEGNNDEEGIAAASLNLGTLNAQQGNYKDGLTYYLKSLVLHENLGVKEDIASSSVGVGLVYMFMKDFEKALEYYQKALSLYEAINDMAGTTMTLNNMANVYQRKGNTDKALELHLKNLKIRENGGNTFQIAQSLGNISLMYSIKKDYSKALEYILKAHELMEKVGDKHYLAESFSNIGRLYGDLGDTHKQIEYHKKSLEISIPLNARDIVKSTYLSLSEAYEEVRNPSDALKYYKLYSAIKDSIYSKENSKLIAEMHTKYETEKKEKAIELLEKNTLLQESEIAREKTYRNSLYGVIGFVSMMSFMFLAGYRNKKRSNEILSSQKYEITLQKGIIEEKNKDITDSINYAKRIQDAMLPADSKIKKALPQSFVLFKPKDIVSGDFYWINHEQNLSNPKTLVAAVDCTGHGVPGAFMSIVGNNLLNKAVNNALLHKPAEILNYINNELSLVLQQRAAEGEIKDGMDMALCSIELISEESFSIEFAGANNPLWIFKRNKTGFDFSEIKGDKRPIGASGERTAYNFTNHQITLSKGDTFYIFTDGYADQFGGEKGKKFKYKPLRELLLTIQSEPIENHTAILEESFLTWKGNLEQVDDVCIIGIRL